MGKHPRAKEVPYSSIVGSSVTLHNETGRVVGQLAILNVLAETPEERKTAQKAVASEVALALNLHERALHSLEVVRDNEMDRINDDEPPTMSRFTLADIQQLLREAGR